ncbi:MAG: response regulator transcription factor [Anaerolineae bacterium]|nr:response regulator transcription factor [Anaerolineae bacterium]
MTHQSSATPAATPAATLIVTPDLAWAARLQGHLLRNGFEPVSIASNGEAALEHMSENAADLVLMDAALPDWKAVDLCVEMLLAKPPIKTVLVTTTDKQSKPGIPGIDAFYAGVSGCIHRDVPLASWPALLMHILDDGVIFTRDSMDLLLNEATAKKELRPHLSIGPLRIDLARRWVAYDGLRIQLTQREFALLIALSRNTDHVVTFDELLNEAWGYDANRGSPAQVRLYIARLRHKIMTQAHAPNFIHTERGVGYRLESEVLRQPKRLPT